MSRLKPRPTKTLTADGGRFGVRVRVTMHRSGDSRAGGQTKTLIEQSFPQRGEEQ